MFILGVYVHIHTKYEVSIFNPVARGLCTDADDADDDTDTDDANDTDNYARWTNHGRIPNETKTTVLHSLR